MSLDNYRKKRDFAGTPEPEGNKTKGSGGRFVVQKHQATRLHYDFRLQIGDVLTSWAVPKGPSMDPSVKRLAIQTEDHPLEYRDFEGTIPADQYGGGTVMIWDEGRIDWSGTEATPEEMLKKGLLEFELGGEKLRGRFKMVKVRFRNQENAWLLIKRKDEHAAKTDVLVERPNSARTGRSLEQIAAESDG